MIEEVKIFENNEEEYSQNSNNDEIIEGEVVNEKWFLSAVRGEKEYLKANAKANAGKFDMNGITALMYCADAGNTDCVKILVNFNEELKKRDKNGNTALILATKKSYADVVKILVKYEAGVTNNEGKTAFDYAIENDDEKCIQILKNVENSDKKHKENKENIKKELKKENLRLKAESEKLEKANEEMEKVVEKENKVNF